MRFVYTTVCVQRLLAPCTPVRAANSIILQLQALGGDGMSVPCGWTALSVCMCIPMPLACFLPQNFCRPALELQCTTTPHVVWRLKHSCGPLQLQLQ